MKTAFFVWQKASVLVSLHGKLSKSLFISLNLINFWMCILSCYWCFLWQRRGRTPTFTPQGLSRGIYYFLPGGIFRPGYWMMNIFVAEFWPCLLENVPFFALLLEVYNFVFIYIQWIHNFGKVPSYLTVSSWVLRNMFIQVGKNSTFGNAHLHISLK